MANRLDWNILEERIEAMKGENDEISTRAAALTVLCLSTMLDISVEDGIDAITDGGNDRGVDAVYIDNRDDRKDIHLVQSKCVTSFRRSKSNFPGNSVDKIITFMTDLLNENREPLNTLNPSLANKIDDIIETQKDVDATYTIHFIGNQASLIQHELDRIRSVFRRYPSVDFEMHDLDSLSDMFLSALVPQIDREFTVIGSNYFNKIDLNLRATVCTIAASDVVNAIRSPENHDEVDLRMFDQNVRVYLKKTNRINREIIDSALSENNHMFWYQNNGITMTCDRFSMSPNRHSPTIKLENVQIVNGRQTSHCLFEVARQDPTKVENILLLVRIIETSSEDIKLAISKSTNSQTPIKVRDLRANDRQQRKLEEGFASRGLYYERKTNQFRDKPRERRIDALRAGQAYLAYGIGKPEVAKKDSGRIFGDLYDRVFSDDISVDKLLIAHILMGRINTRKSILRKRIRSKEEVDRGEIALIDGAFHVLFALREMILSKGHSLWNNEVSDGDIDDAVEIVKTLYLREQERDESFSSNRLFKERRTKYQIVKDVD